MNAITPEALRQIVGDAHVLTDADATPFLTDQRAHYVGEAIAVVRPSTPQQVAAVVALCARHGIAVVPQGGNTGLCGGATPDGTGRAVLVSLTRMNRVRHIDPDNDTITVEAGAVLADVQDAAGAAGRLFPLSLGSEGSCTIGGNLATNAGGTQVLRYGNARALALGLEVVTPSGEIWDGLRGLRKDNAGYDLRDLYIGSEGTLGIITAATLRLFPRPVAEKTAFAAFPSLAAAVAFLAAARAGFGAALTGFELIGGNCLDLVALHCPEAPLPYAADERSAPWHALLQIGDAGDETQATQTVEQVLGAAMEAGLVNHAVVAANDRQCQEVWHVRDSFLGLALRREGNAVSHDISVPISRIPAFVDATAASLQRILPGARVFAYGHLGDGNLHYNVVPPAGAPSEAASLIHRLVYDAVADQGGSISAEHGVGQLKRDELPRYRSALELQLMRALKRAFDPTGLMNPGKVLAVDAGGVCSPTGDQPDPMRATRPAAACAQARSSPVGSISASRR